MHLIIGFFVLLFVVAVFFAYWTTITFNHEELPKLVGAAFGAATGGAVAILLFFLTRAKDQEAKDRETTRLMKGYWQDVWAMLPGVHEEMVYWRARSPGTYGPFAPKLATSSGDLIVEHLKSAFYQANLSSLYRLDLKSQRLLLVFHDNLRIVCEYLGQLIKLVARQEELSRRIGASAQAQADNSGNIQELQYLEGAIEKLAGDVADLLQSAVLQGWAVQVHLDEHGDWQKEYHAPTEPYLPTYSRAWVGGIQSLVNRVSNDRRAHDDVH